jgi:hypothetical protein
MKEANHTEKEASKIARGAEQATTSEITRGRKRKRSRAEDVLESIGQGAANARVLRAGMFANGLVERGTGTGCASDANEMRLQYNQMELYMD